MTSLPAFDDETNPFIAAFLAARGEDTQVGDALPAHTPMCFGCGPDNHGSMGLQATLGPDDSVEAVHVFDDRFIGAPGVAHGGAVSAVLDDLFGFVMLAIREPAVTRDLSVRYRLPVRLGVETHMRAWVKGRESREIHLAAELRQEDHLVATGRAVFIQVDPRHLSAPARKFFS